MAMFLMSLGLVLSSAAAATAATVAAPAKAAARAYEWRNINATYGDETMLLNVAIGDGIIELHSHKPDNAPASFRETSNIHVFSRQLVAMRNSVDKECYVRHIIESFEDLKQKIAGIEQHNSSKGKLSEDWIDVKNVCPIESWAVEELLGDEIDCFCRFHKVYFVGLVHTGTVDPTTKVCLECCSTKQSEMFHLVYGFLKITESGINQLVVDSMTKDPTDDDTMKHFKHPHIRAISNKERFLSTGSHRAVHQHVPH